jgi:hypothetical protein
MSERVQDRYDEEAFEERLESARMNAANDWEEAFVRDLIARYQQVGRRMTLSEAQQHTLERIASDD